MLATFQLYEFSDKQSISSTPQSFIRDKVVIKQYFPLLFFSLRYKTLGSIYSYLHLLFLLQTAKLRLYKFQDYGISSDLSYVGALTKLKFRICLDLTYLLDPKHGKFCFSLRSCQLTSTWRCWVITHCAVRS